MTSIPDHLIDKAARAMLGADPLGPDADWEALLRDDQDTYLHMARAVLEAVADDLRAEAWEQGNRVGWSDCTLDTVAALKAITTNPYRQETDR